MNGETTTVSELPNNLRLLSLGSIGEALIEYYGLNANLIQAHYNEEYELRDKIFSQAIRTFNVIFQRLRSNLSQIATEDEISFIERAVLNPGYTNPGEYIPKILYPAYLIFNELVTRSGLDNLIEYEAPTTHTHVKLSNLVYDLSELPPEPIVTTQEGPEENENQEREKE